MSKDDIFKRVQGILADELGLEKADITLDSNFIDDLNADSLDIVDLVTEMEREFKLIIPDDAAERIRTVADAVDFISENS